MITFHGMTREIKIKNQNQKLAKYERLKKVKVKNQLT